MGAHQCFALGCTAMVSPRLLMCGPHWRLVPKPLQGTIYALYRKRMAGEDVDEETARARAQAVCLVADAEGTDVPNAWRRWAKPNLVVDQKQVLEWVAMDRHERAARIREEAIEVCQTEGLPAEMVSRILESSYSRPVGELGVKTRTGLGIAELRKIGTRLRNGQGNVYEVAGEFGYEDTDGGVAIFADLEEHGDAFRCDECSRWLLMAEKDGECASMCGECAGSL